MFKKILASVGIGNARVDTRLANAEVAPLDVLTGEVWIQGGNVAQTMQDIQLSLRTRYAREIEGNDVGSFMETFELASWRLPGQQIQAGQTLQIPFSLVIPPYAPISIGSSYSYLHTGLSVDLAVDPTDEDQITIVLHPWMKRIFEGMRTLGFQLRDASCKAAHAFHADAPFLQEFEFSPGGEFRRRVEEVEIVFALRENALDVYMEVDRRARGFSGLFSEAFDLNERFAHFTLSREDARLPDPAIAEMLYNTIHSRL